MTDLLVTLSEAQLDALADRVAARLANGDGHAPTDQPDRLLTVDQAAAFLGVKPRWLYGAAVPFRVRLPGSRAVRFSERGLEQWIKRRQGR